MRFIYLQIVYIIVMGVQIEMEEKCIKEYIRRYAL